MKGAFRFLSNFNEKIRKGVEGRKGLLESVASHYRDIAYDRKRIWIHVASFGELEQAKPVIESLRDRYPDCHIHLTFFSPSGYENTIGKYKTPDIITYAPFDSLNDVRSFLGAVKPDLALFAKYDVWPNAITMLHERRVPSILFSATLGQDSGRFFPVVRDFNRRVYSKLSRILVIRESDKQAFVQYGIDPEKIVVAGDTRFDQVLARQRSATTSAIPASLLDRWKEEGRTIIILGSAWEEDITIFFASQSLKRSDKIAWVVVPHEPTDANLTAMEHTIGGNIQYLSSYSDTQATDTLLIDSIGKLFGLYSIADIVYVGGGFSKGAHNTLEAVVWSVPVLVGPRHRKTKEVQELIDAGGAIEIATAHDAEAAVMRLITDSSTRKDIGKRGRAFVEHGEGATAKIMQAIEELK